jgi:heme exporter protein D
MQWASVSEFLAMGGYASYVWGAYGVCAAALAAEVLTLLRRFRKARARVKSEGRE